MSTAMTTKPGPGALGKFLGQDNVKKQLQMALPKHMTVDRLVRVALTAAIKAPKLYECDTNSIAACLLNAAQLGLEPNGRDAHLIPFNNRKRGCYECQLIPDYKGLIQLAYRSGMIDNLTAKAVYEKDVFMYEFGTNESLKHVPCTEDDPGQLVYAWAMVRFKNGGSKFVVLNRRDIAKRRAKSQTANREDSVWNQYPEAMWAKSAVKELSKWIPQTPELQDFHKAVEIDTTADLGTSVINVNSEPEDEESPPSKSEELAEKLSHEREPVTEKPSGLSPKDLEELQIWTDALQDITDPEEARGSVKAILKNTPPQLAEAMKNASLARVQEILGSKQK